MGRLSAFWAGSPVSLPSADTPGRQLSAVVRYGVAVIATLAALLLKLALGPVILPSLYVPFYGAVLVSAWVGGIGPGLVTSLLSFGIGQVLFASPPATLPGTEELALVRDALFLLAAVGLSWGTAALHASQRRVAEVLRAAHDELEARVALRTAELSAANQRLTDEMARRAEAEASFRNAFEYAPIGMALVSPDGRPLQINAALCHMLGYSHDELLRKPIAEVMHPDDFAAANTDRTQLLSGETSRYHAERRYLHRSGALVWAEMNVSVVRDSQGRPLHLVSQLHDITDRHRAQAELEESERRFRGTFAQAAVGIAHVAPDGRFLRINDRFCNLVGYAREEMLQRTFQIITHPADLDADLAYVRQMLEGAISTYAMEKRYIGKDGFPVWVDLFVSLMRDEEGRPDYFIAVVQDIGKRKRAEEALRQSEELLKDQARWLQSILNSLGEAVVVTDAEANLLYFNPVAERLHRRGPAAVAVEEWSKEYGVYFPDGTPVPVDQFPLAQARLGIATTASQEFAIRPYGQDVLIPVSATATPVVAEDGSIQGGVVVYRDISNIKEAEARLRRNEERLKEAERLAHTGAWEWDLTTGEAIWSDEQFRIFGLEPAGSPPAYDAFLPLILPEDRTRVVQVIADTVARRGPFEVECRILRPHGEVRHVYVRGEITRDAADKPIRMMGTVVDTTERKQAESLLESRVAQRTAQLRATQERLRRLVEHLPAITYVLALDAAQTTMYISPQVETTLGFAPEEWMSDPDLWNRQLHPADRDRVIAEVTASHSTGAPFSSDYRMYTRAGALLWFHDEAVVIRDATGQLLFSQGVMIDITARKRAEEELEAANQRTREILEEITDGFYALDPDGRFTYLNPSALRLFERSADELLGKRLWDAFPERSGSAFEEPYRRLMSERVPVSIEAYYAPRNRWYRIRAYPTQQGASVLFEDVTERHREEVAIMSDMLGALNAHLDVAEAFPAVAVGLRRLTGCDRSSVTLFEGGDTWVRLIALDEPREYLRGGVRMRAVDVPAAQDVLNGRPHLVRDLAVERSYPAARLLYANGYRSRLSVPLQGRERVLGILNMLWREPDGPPMAQLEVIRQVGAMVALALEKGRLFEEVHAARERLEALSQRLLQVQEAERQHIARELHDEIGQALTALKLSLDAAGSVSLKDVHARLQATQRQLDELLGRVRNLALDLRPAMLDDLGLLPALVWLFERYGVQAGVHVNFEHRGLERRFNPEIETAAYRIVQEALTNVTRHAGVHEVTVRMWSDASNLCVQIVDHGAGFDAEAALGAGVTSGVAGMRERALLLGGRFTVESAPGKGTRVSAELPTGETTGEVVACP
jgi:PAS domain S-box-containing protein